MAANIALAGTIPAGYFPLERTVDPINDMRQIRFTLAIWATVVRYSG
jgi:hypothetical protein